MTEKGLKDFKRDEELKVEDKGPPENELTRSNNNIQFGVNTLPKNS